MKNVPFAKEHRKLSGKSSNYLFARLKIFEKMKIGNQVRIAFMGSSCTERWGVGAHWSDFLQIGFTHKFRRLNNWKCDNAALFLNAGTSNNTSGELLERFGRDIAPFKPDIVVFMVGGNDSNPVRESSQENFMTNLAKLQNNCKELGADAVWLTYYSCIQEKLSVENPGWAENYPKYMKALRDFGGENCLDIFSRWERLRKYDTEAFALLMRDSLHVNPCGNAVIGLDLMRAFGVSLPSENLPWIRDAVFAQKLLDSLEKLEQNINPDSANIQFANSRM